MPGRCSSLGLKLFSPLGIVLGRQQSSPTWGSSDPRDGRDGLPVHGSSLHPPKKELTALFLPKWLRGVDVAIARARGIHPDMTDL